MTTRRPTTLRFSSTRATIVAAVIAGLAAPPAYATTATTTAGARAYFRVTLEKVTPEKAAAQRATVQVKANALQQTGDPVAAGVALDEAAAVWGDPILYLDAADMYLAAAEEQRDTGLVDAAEERARISRDILFFNLDATADADFKLVPIAEIPALINRAEAILQKSGPLRAEISSSVPEEEEADDEEEDKPKKKRNRKKILFGTGVAAASVGGALLLVGASGLIIGAVRQQDAEDPTVYGDEYDAIAAKGEKGNLIAGLGFGFGGALVLGGVTLIILSKLKPRKDKKKKKKKDDDDEPEDDKVVHVSPTFGGGHGGLALTGRF